MKLKVKPLIIIAIGIIIFLPPFAKYQALRHKNKKLADEIRMLNEETKRLAEEKKQLETDITHIEKRAREKIGVVRKGEIVLKEVIRAQSKK